MTTSFFYLLLKLHVMGIGLTLLAIPQTRRAMIYWLITIGGIFLFQFVYVDVSDSAAHSGMPFEVIGSRFGDRINLSALIGLAYLLLLAGALIARIRRNKKANANKT